MPVAPCVSSLPDHHRLFMAFRLSSTPTKVAAYTSLAGSLRTLAHPLRVSHQINHITHPQVQTRLRLTLAGKARAMAGPNPFHSAVTPSAAINFLAQSKNPEYVPDGADCNLDLIVCKTRSAEIFSHTRVTRDETM